MRRGLAWVAGALGLAALLRALKGRRSAPPDVSPVPESDPADELRAALAEQREEEPAPAPDEPLSIEERRRRVHERAQEAIDSMHDSGA